MAARVVFDEATRKWFEGRQVVQTTVCQCARCWKYYKPSLGHKCKKKGGDGMTDRSSCCDSAQRKENECEKPH